jgi:sugar-specific transcriptional regulator TrmB
MGDVMTAGLGHNKGPMFDAEVVDAFVKEASEIADAASEWAVVEIASDTKAGELKDFLDTARAKLKEIEDRRKAEKQPFLDAGRDVDTAFNRVKDIIEKAGRLAKLPLETYLKEQQRIAEERRRAEQEAARKAAEEAERKRLIAERNRNAAAILEAEEKAKEAAEAAKVAAAPARAKVSSATGTGSNRTGLRTHRSAHITNINQAMLHYRSHADLAECITRLANADIRAAKGAKITIPGIDIIEEQKL